MFLVFGYFSNLSVKAINRYCFSKFQMIKWVSIEMLKIKLFSEMLGPWSTYGEAKWAVKGRIADVPNHKIQGSEAGWSPHAGKQPVLPSDSSHILSKTNK